MSSPVDISWKQLLQEKVEDLYHFRNFFFENHTSEEAHLRDPQVAERLKQTLELFDSLQETAFQEDKAFFFSLKGRAYNVVSEFSQEALDVLEKAVKLNPRLTDAWNELGECFWKKGDLQSALTCFEGSIKKGPNKVGLRKLSMLLRQLPGDKKLERLQTSISHAREAVALDTSDGTSWYILGNALLSQFFLTQQNPKVLQEAMDAYNKALMDPASRCEPNIYYNRSIALKYEEQYEAALKGFEEARRWDPLWQAPQEEIEGLLTYLGQVQDTLHHKGHLKARKIQMLLKGLKIPFHLGPLAASPALSCKPLSDLLPGANTGSLVIGKVVGSLPPLHTLSFTFAIVDSADSNCLSVTVYNLAPGRGLIIGDSIAIPEPFVKDVSVTHKEQKFCFRSIRVTNPLVLVVNGRRMDPSCLALPQLQVTVKSE